MPRNPCDDTAPEVARMLDEVYARMTPAEKLKRVTALTRAANALALAGLRRRHPGKSEESLLERLGELWLRAAGIGR